MLRQIDDALKLYDRSKLTIVFDVRKGPLRNNPVLETVSTERRRSANGFCSALCACGKHGAPDSFQVDIFDDIDGLTAALDMHMKLTY